MVDRRPYGVCLLVFLAVLIVLGWGQQVNDNIYDEYNETEYQEQWRSIFDSLARILNSDIKWPINDNKSQVLYLLTIKQQGPKKQAESNEILSKDGALKVDDKEQLQKLLPMRRDKPKRESLEKSIKNDQRMLAGNVRKYVNDAHKYLDFKTEKNAIVKKEKMADDRNGIVWARLNKLAKRTNKHFAESLKSYLYNKTQPSQRALDLKSEFSGLSPSHYIAVEYNITKPFKNEDTTYNFYIRINVFLL